MKISVFVSNEEQYQFAKRYDVDCIYSSSLKLCRCHTEVYYLTSRVKEEQDLPKRLLVQDFGTIYKEKGKSFISNYTLNVANSWTCELLVKLGVQKIGLSVEIDLSSLKCSSLLKYPVEVVLYGRVEDMILKRHPEMRDGDYELESRNGKYPVKVDADGTVHIYHKKPMDRISELQDLKNLGIRFARLDFLDETVEEMKKIFVKCGVQEKLA